MSETENKTFEEILDRYLDELYFTVLDGVISRSKWIFIKAEMKKVIKETNIKWLEQKRKDFLVESVFGMGEETEKGLKIFDKLIKELE